MDQDTIPHDLLTSEKVTIDYISHYNPRVLKQLLPRHFSDPSLRSFSGDRGEVVDALLMYNRRMNAPPRVIENIEALSQPETYAVVTGQQPGIFSGPLYTVYKAISAITICERLSRKGRSLIPVFWNASEDHDLSEVDHITMFKENEPFEIHYDYKSDAVPLSHIPADKSRLRKMLTIAGHMAPNSEFKPALLKEVDTIIESSLTIGDFFSRFMLHLFGDLGLAMIEPHDLRELMAPVFRKLVEHPTECTRILAETNSKLVELGYSPRIHKKANMCNFFLIDDDGRRSQVTFDTRFQAGRKSFGQKELRRLLDDNPSKFSTNAITRPISQDFLLPTFAYVAGPSELAYYAQLKGVYDFFSLEMPVIFPRFGATLVERKISRILGKYKARIPEFRNPERLTKRLAMEKVDDVFRSFKNEVSGGMKEITQKVKSIDKTLVPSCSLTRGKILKSVEALEDRIASKLKEHDLVTRSQISKAHNNLFPFGDLQERRINVLEYLMKFGSEFLAVVHRDFLNSEYGEHRVIRC